MNKSRHYTDTHSAMKKYTGNNVNPSRENIGYGINDVNSTIKIEGLVGS